MSAFSVSDLKLTKKSVLDFRENCNKNLTPAEVWFQVGIYENKIIIMMKMLQG